MKRSGPMSSVLLELILVVLFFGLSVTVALRLFAAAGESSESSRAKSIAVIKLQEYAEELRSDPASGEYEGDVRQVSRETEGLLLSGEVRRTAQPRGWYYEIALTASEGGEILETLTAGRYVPEVEE